MKNWNFIRTVNDEHEYIVTRQGGVNLWSTIRNCIVQGFGAKLPGGLRPPVHKLATYLTGKDIGACIFRQG